MSARNSLAPPFELTVTLEDGHLVVQATSQGGTRLSPYTEVDFFVTEIDAQITFQKDAAGTVTGMDFLHQNGQDAPAAKLR